MHVGDVLKCLYVDSITFHEKAHFSVLKIFLYHFFIALTISWTN